jgi:hypothetical protein
MPLKVYRMDSPHRDSDFSASEGSQTDSQKQIAKPEIALTLGKK